MKINMILAVGPNDIVGLKDKMPWHSKKDFFHFKHITLNKPCIFGKNTFFGLPKYPLKNRLNIVLDNELPESTVLASDDGYFTVGTLSKALNMCKAYDECYICGGVSLFKYCLKEGLVDEVILTRVDSASLVEDDRLNPDKYIKFDKFDELLNKNYKLDAFIEYITDEYLKLKEDSDIKVNYVKYIKK